MSTKRNMLVAGLLGAIVVPCLFLGSFAQGGDELDDHIQREVERLGAERFADREAAMQWLWETGKPAVRALREAIEEGDPEVTVRAKKVLAKIQLGILPDTPPRLAALMERFQEGDEAGRRKVLDELRNPSEQSLRLRLILTVEEKGLRNELIGKYIGSGDILLAGLREIGDLASARELLRVISPRDWAMHVFLSGEMEVEIARLEGKAVDPQAMVWLALVADDLEKARILADGSGDRRLQLEVYLRQADWKPLLALRDPIPLEKRKVEGWGFKAAFYSKAGEQEKAKRAIDELLVLAVKEQGSAWSCAEVLMINDRWDLVEQVLAGGGGREETEMVNFFRGRLEFEEAFKRFDLKPPLKGTTKIIEERIAGMKKEALVPGGPKAKELYNKYRGLAVLLDRVGEREEAKGVRVASEELISSDHRALTYHWSNYRSYRYPEEQKRLEKEILKMAKPELFLTIRFSGSGKMAGFWWEYFESVDPGDSIPERLQRIAEVLEPEEGADLGDLFKEADKWIKERAGEAKDADHLAALGQTYLKHGDWEKALTYMDQEAQEPKRRAAGLLAMADLWAKHERWKEAAGRYAEVAELEPGNALATYLHGHALRKLGQEKEGDELRALAFLLPAANSDERERLARQLSNRGMVEDADRLWQLVIRSAEYFAWSGKEPSALRQAIYKVATEIGNEQPKQAADLWDHYLHTLLTTNSSMGVSGYPMMKEKIHFLRFKQHMAAGDLEMATMSAWALLNAQPGAVVTTIQIVKELKEAGREKDAQELYESVAERLRKVVKAFPNSTLDQSMLTRLEEGCGDPLDEDKAEDKPRD